jgi:hypothetical protein
MPREDLHRTLLRVRWERRIAGWAERLGAEIPYLLVLLAAAAVTAGVLFSRHHG